MARLKNSSNATTNSNSLPANKQKGKKICTCCHQEKKLTDFYLSYSPMYSLDQRVPVCKECCKSSVLNEDGTIDYMRLKELLMHIDKPLYYDQLYAAEISVKKENSYLSDTETALHGSEILSKYFTLVAMRQDRATSFSDSEKDGFMHPNTNRSDKELNMIKNKYYPLFNHKSVSLKSDNNADEKVSNNSPTTFNKQEEIVKWTKRDKQNMKYVISTIGYDPFEDVGLTEFDKKYCFNILAGYCDTPGISEDGHKMHSVIEMTILYAQCRKITEEMNTEFKKSHVDDNTISKLASSKSQLLSSISKIAQDNNISSKYNKNSKQGQNSLSSKMKEMEENGFDDVRVNLFDIKTSQAFKQIDEISNTNIANQLTLDSNEYTDIIKEQREMITQYESDIDELREENRTLKNKIIDLENSGR